MSIEIYKGPIKRMSSFSKLDLNTKNIKKIFSEEVLVKDATFYRNFIGKKINFESDNYLPDRMEATDYITDGLLSAVNFVDYEELEFVESVDKKTFKEMKKSLRK